MPRFGLKPAPERRLKAVFKASNGRFKSQQGFLKGFIPPLPLQGNFGGIQAVLKRRFFDKNDKEAFMYDYENRTQGFTNDELKNEQEKYITEHGCRECEFFSDDKWDIKKCVECDWNLKNRR